MEKKPCNVFVSHIHEDDAKLGKLKDLLAAHGCTMRDSSINSSRPNEATSADYIKNSILAPRIRWAGTLLVLISPGTHKSDWVNWEIEYARKEGKRIVGVWDHGAKDCDKPTALDDYGDSLVCWQGKVVMDAIFGEADTWQTSAGGPPETREIARHGCQPA